MSTTSGKDPRRWAALVAMSLAVFLVAVDGTVLSLATPSIVRDLQPSASQVLWIGDIYSFVLAGLLITMGNLGDRVGRKRLLMIGGVAFAVLSVAAAYSPNAEWLIINRAALGVAGATLMPSTLALMRSTFIDPVERSFAIGVWSAMGAAGAAAGPLFGGALLQHFWWGSVFLVNVPIMALVMLIGIPSLRESRNPAAGAIDLLSVGLSMVGIIGLVYAVKEIAIEGLQTQFAAVGVVGLVAAIWFVRRQGTLETPLVDVSLFRNSAFSGAVLANLLSVFGLAGALFFFSQYLQFIKGLQPLQAGLFELPATIAALVAALLAGNVMRRFGRGPSVAVSLLAIGLGMAGVALVLDSTHYLAFAIPLILIGAGDGVALTVSSDTVLAVAPKDRAGAASAVSETGYELGTALGIALLGSVLTAVYQSTLRLPPGLPQDVAQGAEQSPGEAFEKAAGLPPDAAQGLTDAVHVAFTDAMQVTTLAGAVVLVLGAVMAWRLLPGRSAVPNEMVAH